MSEGVPLETFFERTPPPRRAGELSRFSFPRFATLLFGPSTGIPAASVASSLQLLPGHLQTSSAPEGELSIRARVWHLPPAECMRGEEGAQSCATSLRKGRRGYCMASAPLLFRDSLSLTSPSRASMGDSERGHGFRDPDPASAARKFSREPPCLGREAHHSFGDPFRPVPVPPPPPGGSNHRPLLLGRFTGP
jgi:hypothetical protein